MTMFLLDTDHLVILQHEADREFSVLHERMSRHVHEDFSLSIVSFHEQMLGANQFISRAKTQAQVTRGYQMMEVILIDFSRFRVLPFDQPAAAQFVRLRKARVRIGTMDLRIAAIAASHQLTVLTRNTRDFGQVPDLTVEDWTR
jgi:tRNA(fMet)-specific endonuclease VapC